MNGKRIAKRTAAIIIAVVVALTGLVVGTSAPSAAHYGTKTHVCSTHFKSARATLKHSVLGMNVNATELGCSQRSRPGAKFITWGSTPRMSFTAGGLVGSLQSVNVRNEGLRSIHRTRMTPWQFPLIYNPQYLIWMIVHKHKIMRVTSIRHDLTARVCTLSIAGTRLCQDVDYRVVFTEGKGLKVCSIGHGNKCSPWRRFA